MKKFGYRKGALSKAAEEAILKWTSTVESETFEGEPMEAIDGLLSDVNMDSVTLQYEAKKFGCQKCLKMYLVDTNIFLEVLLGRSKKEECKRLLRNLRDGKKNAVVTDFSIHSIIYSWKG